MTEQQPDFLRSFGRRKGRKLRPGKQGLVEGMLPKLGVGDWGLGIGDGAHPSPEALIPKPLWLEIGFGGGEHLAHQAALHRVIIDDQYGFRHCGEASLSANLRRPV